MTTSTGLMKKAQAAFASGNLKNSEKLCRKLLRDHQVQLPVRALLAQTLIKQNRLEEAADFAIEAAEMDQSNIGLQTTTGDLLERLKKYDEAFPFYQRALMSEPSNPAYWRKLLSNMHKSALEADSPSSADGLSLSLFLGERTIIPDELLQLASKALQTFPDDGALVTLIGEIYFDADQMKPAEMCFERALDYRPIVKQAHHNWLKLKFEAEQPQQILDYADAHEEAVANNALCMRIIAAAHEKMGDDATALTYLKRAIALAPTDPEYIGARGRLLIHLARFSEARKDLEHAAKVNPDEASHRNNLRIVYQCLGMIAKAAQNEFARLKLNTRTVSYNFKAPHWTNQSLTDKRLLIWSDQGIGDVFKFGLLIPELPDDCHPIIMSAPKTVEFLKAALPHAEVRVEPRRVVRIKQSRSARKKSSEGFKPFLERKNDTEFQTFEPFEENCDLQIPLGMLYCNLRPDLASFQEHKRTFELPAPVIKRFADLDILSDKDCVRVGIAWNSKMKSEKNKQIYLEPETLLPIFKMPGFQFFNFDYTVPEEEVTDLRETLGIPLFRAPGLDLYDDMLGTAAFVACMDLFIGPNSTSSDIAGSMGTRCLRYHPAKSNINLGQDHVPWYIDQKSVSIAVGSSAVDIIPEMKDWLLANKSHRGKYREL